MNVILIFSLIGMAAFAVQDSTCEELSKVSVSVWPPGSNIYLGESVLLQCSVESNSSSVWSYRWFRQMTHTAQTSNPRHALAGDNYSITAVTREDAGSYWCQAEDGNTTMLFLSPPTALTVSERLPPSLTLTPSTRQIFRGERFTVQCPESHSNSSGWMLRHFPQEHGARTRHANSALEGADRPAGMWVFTAVSSHSGLYWCEAAEGRSTAVNITVSYGTIIINTPAFAVSEGDEVVLSCQYSGGNHTTTTFFKDGAQIITHRSFSSEMGAQMKIENVTKADEGFYKCVSQDGQTQSPESWLSVRGNSRPTDGSAASSQGSWKWIAVLCGIVLLFLISSTVWLVRHLRYNMFCKRNGWTLSKEEPQTAELPATKQDVTEVQWDLSWMEMSNLLDKQQYPGT